MKLHNFKKKLQLMTNSSMDYLLHMFHYEQVFFLNLKSICATHQSSFTYFFCIFVNLYLLEQRVFSQYHLLSFDNNKVLKIINWTC